MKTNILILIFMIAVTGTWTYFSDGVSNRQRMPQEKVSDFNFETLKGEKYALFDYKGRVILLHFWATWCAPCLEELPQLMDLAQNEQQKLTVIAVAVADKKSNIQRFLSKIKKTPSDNFVIALDPDKTISKELYGTIKLPETYVISPHLELFEKITGAENSWNKKIIIKASGK